MSARTEISKMHLVNVDGTLHLSVPDLLRYLKDYALDFDNLDHSADTDVKRAAARCASLTLRALRTEIAVGAASAEVDK